MSQPRWRPSYFYFRYRTSPFTLLLAGGVHVGRKETRRRGRRVRSVVEAVSDDVLVGGTSETAAA